MTPIHVKTARLFVAWGALAAVSAACDDGAIRGEVADLGPVLDAEADAGSATQDASPDGGVIRDASVAPDGGESADGSTSPDAAVTDDAAPRLLFTTPAEGQTIDVRSPILLVFDEPLAPATVGTATFLVTASGVPIARNVTLLPGRSAVEVLLTETVLVPDTISVAIAPDVTDDAGNAFGGASFEFDAPSYLSYPGAISQPAAAAVVVPARGPMLATRTSEQIALWSWTGHLTPPSSEALTRPGGTAVDGPWVIHEQGLVWVAWVETHAGAARIQLTSYDEGGERRDLQPLAMASSADPATLSIGVLGGAPVVAYSVDSTPGAELWRLTGNSWQALEVPPAAVATGSPVVASIGDQLWWAAPFGDAIQLWTSNNGGVWLRHSDIETSTPTDVQMLEDRQGRAVVAWIADAGAQRSLHVSTVSAQSTTAPTPAANVDIYARVERFSLGEDELGRPTVTWVESTAVDRSAFVAAFDGAFWRHRRGVLENDPRATAVTALASDEFGRPIFVGWESNDLRMQLANGAPTDPDPSGPLFDAESCAPLPLDGPDFPTTLAETGCFDDQGLTPKAGVIPYSTTSQLWSDNAVKRRWLALPPGEVAEFNATADGAWRFPVGTVLIKEFAFDNDGRRAVVETRIFAKRCETGCSLPWQGYSYRWAPDGSTATLQPADTSTVVSWAVGDRTFDHIYPSRSQCLACHNAAPGYVLGLSTVQLNRRWRYGHLVRHQIETLVRSSVVSGAPAALNVAALPRLVRHPDPHAAALETRVRSYLHANCSSCHRQGALSPWLNLLAPADGAGNLCDQITQGAVETSPLWQRMATRVRNGSITPMPPLATDEVDERALDIVGAWIEGSASCP